MLVTPDWCRLMTRYNAWQNGGMADLVAGMTDADARQDRGAFFGSILGTLNHVLWADLTWLGRIEGRPAGLGGIPGSATLTPDAAAWAARRREADARLSAWAGRVTAEDLAGDLTWTPASGGPARTQPLGLVASHLFNHSTHHRGQVHAMLTAAGRTPPATDLVAMPAEAP